MGKGAILRSRLLGKMGSPMEICRVEMKCLAGIPREGETA